MRLTWKKQPRETGLSAIGAGPRGTILSIDGKEIASVSSLHVGGFGIHEHGGWYWSCARDAVRGIEYKNTHKTPVADIEAAKAECETYIRKCLGMPEKKR